MTASMPTADLGDVLDILTEFPHATGAFGEMRRYVRSVAQFSDFPSAQAVTRLKAELRKTTDPVREGELQYEIEEAERDAALTVPRIVWGSILVAVYATFETGVRNVLTHWAASVPLAAPFVLKGSGQFLKTAEEYAAKTIGVPLFPEEPLKESVRELKEFRDSFAHSAGRMPSRRTGLHTAIDKARKRGYEIAISDDNWIAGPRLAAYYLLRTERAYKIFSGQVMNKYVSCKLSPNEA